MGQKVNPTLYRLGTIFSWKSKWFANKHDYSNKVVEDYRLREYLHDKLSHAGLDEVVIERSLAMIKIVLKVSRPGVVIGKGGSNLQIIKRVSKKLLLLRPGINREKRSESI